MNVNRKLTEQHKKKISDSCRGLVKKKNSPTKSVPVLQYDVNYELVGEYPSVMEASRQTGIPQPNISAAANGKILSAGGFFWSFF